MNRPPVSHPTTGRRLLGDARREATAQLHLAASKRRRLAQSEDVDPVDDDNNFTDTRALDDNDVAIFAGAEYEDDDKEADVIYKAVEERMDSRRQKQREQRLKLELKKYRDANPTVKQHFADLKADLSQVSVDQWASIPDIGDSSIRKQTFKNYTPLPDSLLESARQETKYAASEQAPATDLASIGAGLTSVLGQRLDSTPALAGQTIVDADSYLSEITGSKITTQSDISDIKKARMMLKSVTKSNPTHVPGWLAGARLEESAGKISDARKVILEACRRCPRSDEIWVEAARLHPREVGRRVLASGVRNVPKSEKIWLYAAFLEEDKGAKRRVLRKALEIIEQSEMLWKAAVELEDSDTARVLLGRAVECVPTSVDLWLGLAKLEPYEQASETLRRAREAVVGKVDEEALLRVWITSAQLEEVKHGQNSEKIAETILEAVKMVSTLGNVGREVWLREVEKVDSLGYEGTVRAIVKSSLHLNVEEASIQSTWMKDANEMEAKGCMIVARSIYQALVLKHNQDEDMWVSYAEFERRSGDTQRAAAVLTDGVAECKKSEMLWLMLAKDRWKSSGADAGRKVLHDGLEEHEKSEAMLLAAAKLESESGCYEEGRKILERAQRETPSAKVYMKAALLERVEGRHEAVREILERGLKEYPKGYKLWLMLAQCYEMEAVMNGDDKMVEDLRSASSVYAKGVEECPKCVFLWIGYARWVEKKGMRSRGRAILETARLRCKGLEEADVIWRESVHLEVRDGDVTAGRRVLARGLQECKKSGKLWALSIAVESKSAQKAKSVDAVKKCGQNAGVLVEVGKYIWRGGKTEKARTWLKRAVEMDEDWGDGWAVLLKFEQMTGRKRETIERIERDCQRADAKHGDVWVSVSKKVGNEKLSCLQVLRRVAEMVGKTSCLTGIYECL